jgi:hypothetical protein
VRWSASQADRYTHAYPTDSHAYTYTHACPTDSHAYTYTHNWYHYGNGSR